MPKASCSEVQKVAATFSPTVDVKPGHVPLVATTRRVAIVAQSAASVLRSSIAPKRSGLRSAIASAPATSSDLGAGEFLDYMVQDASTDVILLFIEGIRDVDKFLAAARRAAEIGKPVIVTKVGRSGAGERAAASHTASMAGWSAAYDAVFAKYGFIISNDLDEAVTIAAVLTTNPLPKGDRVGGAHGVGRRRHLGRGHRFAAGPAGAGTVACRSRREIAKLIPSYGAARNPIDVTAQGVTSGGLQKSIDLLDASDEVDAILVVLSLSSEVTDAVQAGGTEAGDIGPEQADRVLFLYAAVALRAQRTGKVRRRGAVGIDPCRRRDAAVWWSARKFKLAPPAEIAASAAARYLRASEIADVVGIRQQVAAARRRHCLAGRSAGDGKETDSMPRSRASAFRW